MYVEVNGENCEVVIERKRIRHTYVRVRDDLKIHVSTSKLTSDKDIKKLIIDEYPKIKEMFDRQVHKNEKQNYILGNPVDIVVISNLVEPELYKNKLFIKDRSKLDNYYKALAMQIFKERLDHLYNNFEERIKYPILKIRKMTSRWGVCNRKDNSITLNLELIKKDISCIDYVIVHELSHFVHFNHSHSFWELVEKYISNYKAIRKILKD